MGKPIPGVKAKIVNPETWQEAPTGEPGMLLVTGPNVMKGYYRNPELTADALNEGWFNTRGLGRLDSEGNLFIVGRSREIIVRFGYKMLPVEIEAVLERRLGVPISGRH